MNKLYNPSDEKMVDTILGMPDGPERWRETIKVWLLKNPTDAESGLDARTEWPLQLAENKRLRETQTNKFSATESGALRLGFSIPFGAWTYLKLFNPRSFNSADPETTKRNVAKFAKAFPGLTIPEKM